MPTGDEAKFQELQEAYEVLEELRTRPYSRAAAGRSSESPHVAAHREAQRSAHTFFSFFEKRNKKSSRRT